MRRLSPIADDPDAIAAHLAGDRHPRAGRPWVVAGMIASVDGGAAVEGRSGALGGPVDKLVFRALRALADVVLVAAGTVRAERYGPPRLPPEERAARTARGQTPVPAIAVVSGSLHLDWGSALFADAELRPIVLTSGSSPAGPRERAAEVADVVICGDDGVDPGTALAELGGRGAGVVLCEGGPGLLGQLVGAGLVDELCLTVSPKLVGGGAFRIVAGEPLAEPAALHLASVLEDDGFLLLRYLATPV